MQISDSLDFSQTSSEAARP